MVKQYDHFFEDLTTYVNLYQAYKKAARGKRGLPEVAAFAYHEDDHLFQLQRELQVMSYKPGLYRSFYILDPKRRLISAAPFRDRVVHHALCNLIEPLFERTFIGDSYANRVGKGTHRALDRAQAFAKQYPYVLQCDVKQFFPSVDHAVLRAILRRKITDERVLWLCDLILQSGEGVLNEEYEMQWFPGDDLLAASRPRGLPIGNLTSQFWGNVYMNELDQFIKRRLHVRAYVRYVDDFLLFAADKETLWVWKQALRPELARLRLTLHEGSSTVYPTRTGIPFLGFRLYPDQRKLKRKNGVAFSRRLRRSYRELARGEISTAKLHERVQGWIAHVAHGNTWGLRRALFRSPLPAGALIGCFVKGPGMRRGHE
jgi:RNA-directed DNA polymerase